MGDGLREDRFDRAEVTIVKHSLESLWLWKRKSVEAHFKKSLGLSCGAPAFEHSLNAVCRTPSSQTATHSPTLDSLKLQPIRMPQEACVLSGGGCDRGIHAIWEEL